MRKFAKYITDYSSSKPTIAKNFRTKRIQIFLEMIMRVYEKKGSVNILDIGGTVEYWNIVESEFFEKYDVNILLLNIPGSKTVADTHRIKHVDGDATADLWDEYDKNLFDLIHSNSVVEHVGDWEKMKKFAQNIKMFDGGYYVQTPNYWFPIEPHCMTPFFHWLPKPIRVFLVQKFTLGYWEKASDVSHAVEIVESARMLSRSMFESLFEDAEIHCEKLFILSKSFSAVRTSYKI